MLIFYLVVMSVSLFGMFIIFGMKISELRGNRNILLSRISAKADPNISKWITSCRWLVGNINFNNVKKLSVFVSHNIFHIFGIVGLFVNKHYMNLAGKVRGRRFLKSLGNREPVSFFLKDVAESKEEDKKDL